MEDMAIVVIIITSIINTFVIHPHTYLSASIFVIYCATKQDALFFISFLFVTSNASHRLEAAGQYAPLPPNARRALIFASQRRRARPSRSSTRAATQQHGRSAYRLPT